MTKQNILEFIFQKLNATSNNFIQITITTNSINILCFIFINFHVHVVVIVKAIKSF